MSTIRRLMISVLVAAAIAAIRQSAEKAQYDCSFPLAWPFCIAGAAVYAAGAIATAPFQPYYYDPYYYGPTYYAPGYYYYPHYHHHHHGRHHYY